MKYWFFAYMILAGWFFFWFVPRVNDGRIEKVVDKAQHVYHYKIKRGYHWKYLPSMWYEEFCDQFKPAITFHKYKIKKFITSKRSK